MNIRFCRNNILPYALIILIIIVCILPSYRVCAAKKKVYYYTVKDVVDIPVKFNDGKYYYHSTNTNVLQFNNSGKMVACHTGESTVVLTYYNSDNKQCRKKFIVKVHDKVKKIKWKKKKKILYIGEQYKFSVKYKVKNKENVILKWSSSDPNVAYVDEDGEIHTLSEGKAIIKCSVKGQKKATVSEKIQVKSIPVSSIHYNDDIIRLKLGAYYNVNSKIVIDPVDATNKLLNTVSEDENIVRVENGFLYGVSKGETTIVVSTNDGSNKSLRIKVLVDNWLNYNDISYIAHRGLSSEAPENTLKAFELAARKHFYATECDVFISKDGEFIVNHDGNIMRTCGVNKQISELTTQEIKSYKITDGAEYEKYCYDESATTTPTLKEYLTVCKNNGIVPMIEVKFNEGTSLMKDSNILYKFYSEIKDVMGDAPVIIISIYDDMIINLNEIVKQSKDSAIKFYLLVWYNQKVDSIKLYDYCLKNNIGFSVGYKGNEELIRNMKKDGSMVCVWTIDDCEQAAKFIDLGVDYIVTDKVLWCTE